MIEPTTCETCGKVHLTHNGQPACPGHIRNGTDHGVQVKEIGEPCAHELGWGCPSHPGYGLCRLHGGNMPVHIRAAQYEMAEAGVATYGLARDIDPFDAFREEIARTAGHIDYLAGIIASLDEQDLVFGISSEVSSTGESVQGTYEQTTKEAARSVWLQLYIEERKHLVNVCKTAVSCGLAEREVRLAEQQGVVFANLVKAFLADPELALTPEQQEKAPHVASRHLRSLPGVA